MDRMVAYTVLGNAFAQRPTESLEAAAERCACHGIGLYAEIARSYAKERMSALAQRVLDETRYVLIHDLEADRHVSAGTIAQFCADNEEAPEVCAAVRALKRGESVEFGGGAAPFVCVTRTR